MKMYKVIKLITPWKLSIQLKYMPLLAANTDNIRYGKANIPWYLAQCGIFVCVISSGFVVLWNV